MAEAHEPKVANSSAVVACLSCRRLKMRCVGADHPPCMRCQKSGRHCEVVASHRHAKKQVDVLPSSSEQPVPIPINILEQSNLLNIPSFTVQGPQHQPSDTATSPWSQHLFTLNASSANGASNDSADDSPLAPVDVSSTPFPAPYIASPFDTIASELVTHDAKNLVQSVGDSAHLEDDILDDDLPQIIQLIEFFQATVLQNVPFLRSCEFVDIHTFIRKKKLLAYAIALVASSFVPGTELVRESLQRQTWSIIHSHSSSHATLSQDELWNLLQTISLLVLYPCPSKNNESGLPDYSGGSLPLFPSLKTFAEHLALRLQLHRSSDQMAAALSRDFTSKEVDGLISRCLMWLVLFTISCHWSILAGTPPTIPHDRSITLGCEVLNSHQEDPAVWRVLCEVEMFTIWNKYPLLREWWCTPGCGDPKRYKSEVAQFDADTCSWSRRWTRQTDFSSTHITPAHFNNIYVDFLLRHTQFHVGAYAARSASGEHSWSGKVSQRSFDGELINAALQKASHKNNHLSQVSPIAIATARYVPPIAYAMSAYSALFIITACEAVPQVISGLDRHLASVNLLANFMQAIATPTNISPKMFGNQIAVRLERAKQNITLSRTQSGNTEVLSLTNTPGDDDFENGFEMSLNPLADAFGYTDFLAEPFEDIDMFGLDFHWP